MKQSGIHFLFKSMRMSFVVLAFVFGITISIHAAAPSSAQTVPDLVKEIEKHLREAVDTANIAVRLKDEEVKGDLAIERLNKKRSYYSKACMQAIEKAERLLKNTNISGSYQNIDNAKGPDFIAAMISSGQVSAYLRDVEDSGFVKLAGHLEAWRKNIKEAELGVIEEDNIEQKYLNSLQPDLLSCVVFWEQFKHSASPCFKEILELFEEIGCLQGKMSVIVAEKMTYPERISYKSGLQAIGGVVRGLTDTFGFTKPQGEQDKRICGRSFCNKFSAEFGVILTRLNTLKSSILGVRSCGDNDFYKGILSEFIDLEDELWWLKAQLDEQLSVPPNESDLIMGKVIPIVQSSMDKLRKIDKSLRKATRGWSNSKDRLTQDQQFDLDEICDHDDIFDGIGGIYKTYVNFVETFKQILPSKNLDLYEERLAEHLRAFESSRGKKFIWPQDPPTPQQGGGSLILSLLSLNHTRDCIEWLASIGFPPAIDHIKNASEVIDESVARTEQLRVTLAKEFQNVKNVKSRMMPLKSLVEISKIDVFNNSVISGDYNSRCERLFREHQKKEIPCAVLTHVEKCIKRSSIRIEGRSEELPKSIGWYCNINKTSQKKVVLKSLLDDVNRDSSNFETVRKLYAYLKVGQDFRGTLLKDLKAYGEKIKSYEIDALLEARAEGFAKQEFEIKRSIGNIQQWFQSIKDRITRDKVIGRKMELGKFWAKWGNCCQTYTADNPEHEHVLPAIFLAMISSRRDDKLRASKKYFNGLTELEEGSAEINKRLLAYSSFARAIAPAANFLGLKWGNAICLLKDQLQRNATLINSLYRKHDRAYNSYVKYDNLCYLADVERRNGGLSSIGETINLNSPTIRQYFNFSSIPLNDR